MGEHRGEFALRYLNPEPQKEWTLDISDVKQNGIADVLSAKFSLKVFVDIVLLVCFTMFRIVKPLSAVWKWPGDF